MIGAAVFAAVMAAGGLGALIRYRTTVAGLRRGWPAHRMTWLVNVAGSAAFGALTGAAIWHGLADSAHLLLTAGLCGGLTTFSTSVLETVQLVQAGRPRAAAAQLLGTLATTIVAAAAGLAALGPWFG